MTHDESGNPAVTVMRLDGKYDTAAFIANAKRHIGEPYDHYFMPDNGRMYCSELVYESYRDENGNPIFTARPMNFRAADGRCPNIGSHCSKHSESRYRKAYPGTNPNDMAREQCLVRLPDAVWRGSR